MVLLEKSATFSVKSRLSSEEPESPDTDATVTVSLAQLRLSRTDSCGVDERANELVSDQSGSEMPSGLDHYTPVCTIGESVSPPFCLKSKSFGSFRDWHVRPGILGAPQQLQSTVCSPQSDENEGGDKVQTGPTRPQREEDLTGRRTPLHHQIVSR